MLYVCFIDYLDKEETEVMKRRGDAEKDSLKAEVVWEKNRGPKGRR